MCMILKNVSLVLVEMNRQDVFTRLFFLPSSSLVFGITESLWSSFAGGRQYGVWAGERHSSCSCLPQCCSSPLPCTLLVNALLAIPRTFILRGLELFSKGIEPAMAHPKIIERRRSPMGGMLAQWGADRPVSPVQACKGMRQHLPWCRWAWYCCLAGRGAKASGIRAILFLYGADVSFSPGCLTWKFVAVQVLFLKAGGVKTVA